MDSSLLISSLWFKERNILDEEEIYRSDDSMDEIVDTENKSQSNDGDKVSTKEKKVKVINKKN